MNTLVERAIEQAGLADILPARRTRTLTGDHAARLRAADLLVLGALADSVRADEVGPAVRIYLSEANDDGAPFLLVPRDGADLTGLELLREVAVARVAGPRGARVRVDWTRCGLELAQVALGFGADELVGRIASKRGLPIADGELSGVGKRSARVPAQLVKRNELASYVRRAGRTPVFVNSDGAAETRALEGAIKEAG